MIPPLALSNCLGSSYWALGPVSRITRCGSPGKVKHSRRSHVDRLADAGCDPLAAERLVGLLSFNLTSLRLGEIQPGTSKEHFCQPTNELVDLTRLAGYHASSDAFGWQEPGRSLGYDWFRLIRCCGMGRGDLILRAGTRRARSLVSIPLRAHVS